MIADFLEKMGKLEILTYVGLDDFADKLNFLFSVWLLILFCSVTTVKTYFLSPITCYIPNIAGSHEGQAAYITNYCYTEGTYNVPLEDFKIDNENPHWMDPYKDKKIYYYQWLPFLLGIQGIMCYIPRIIWYLFANNRAGSDLTQLIRLANDAHKAENDKREKLVTHIAKNIELWIYNNREYRDKLHHRIKRSLGACLPSKRMGTWLVFIYMIIKLLYIANNIGQLYLMHTFLQFDKYNYTFTKSGMQLLGDLLSGQDWQNTGVFPRSGCCAIKTRQAAYAQYLFAQCSLPVNMINEKIFIFLWFWFIFVLCMTILSFFIWIFRMVTRKNRKRLVKKYLYLSGVYVPQKMTEEEKMKLGDQEDKEKTRMNNFVGKFLRHDGAFLLQMIALNCGDVVTTEICHAVYHTYCKKYSTLDFRGEASSCSPKNDCVFIEMDETVKYKDDITDNTCLLTKRQVSINATPQIPSAPPPVSPDFENNNNTTVD